MGRIGSFHEVAERYKLLRFASVVLAILGTILLVCGVLLLGVTTYLVLTTTATPVLNQHLGMPPFQNNSMSLFFGGAVGFLWSIGLLFSGLELLIVAALLQLAIHLEENTRATAQALEALSQHSEPRPSPNNPFLKT